MKDVHFLVRKAFFAALNGHLSYKGQNVPVYDDQATGNENIYVVLSSQDSNENSTFSHFQHNAFILLDIIDRTSYSSTKKAVDDIAGQIMNIVRPTPSTVGLAAQAGIQIMNVKFTSPSMPPFKLSEAETINRRLLRASLIIHET